MSDQDGPSGKQRQFLTDLGVETIPTDLTRDRASDWITELREFRSHSERGSTGGPNRIDIYKVPPGGQPAPAPAPAKQSEFKTGSEVAEEEKKRAAAHAEAPTGPTEVQVYEDDERTPLTPVSGMVEDERKKYGIAESGTAVIQGTKWNIVPELGMPAKFVFARLVINKRTSQPEARLFPSIEGLVFRANAYNGGIKTYSYEFIDQKEIPGLAPFLEETKDPELICRVHVILGDGTDVIEHGTVRLSEVKQYTSRRTGRLVSRSPVARSNPTEIAVKRALARALRWGTGFGGTAVDELPVPESEEAREKAGLKGGSAALPPGKKGTA